MLIRWQGIGWHMEHVHHETAVLMHHNTILLAPLVPLKHRTIWREPVENMKCLQPWCMKGGGRLQMHVQQTTEAPKSC